MPIHQTSLSDDAVAAGQAAGIDTAIRARPFTKGFGGLALCVEGDAAAGVTVTGVAPIASDGARIVDAGIKVRPQGGGIASVMDPNLAKLGYGRLPQPVTTPCQDNGGAASASSTELMVVVRVPGARDAAQEASIDGIRVSFRRADGSTGTHDIGYHLGFCNEKEADHPGCRYWREKK